jgi:hypothetical protein
MKQLDPFILGIIGAVVVIGSTLLLTYILRRKPKYIVFTADEVSDNMHRQSAYLVKRIKGIERVEPNEREARIERIEEQLQHFKKTFSRVDGFRHEWDDLNIYLQQQKNIFSVSDLQR